MKQPAHGRARSTRSADPLGRGGRLERAQALESAERLAPGQTREQGLAQVEEPERTWALMLAQVEELKRLWALKLARRAPLKRDLPLGRTQMPVMELQPAWGQAQERALELEVARRPALLQAVQPIPLTAPAFH